MTRFWAIARIQGVTAGKMDLSAKFNRVALRFRRQVPSRLLGCAAVFSGVIGWAGCAVIYPELQSATHIPKEGQVLDPPAPEELYFLYIESASIPPKTPGGLDWEGGAPDPFAKLIVNNVEILHTAVQSRTLEPTWPGEERHNLKVQANSQMFVEVWDDNPITNKPICRAPVRDLNEIRDGGNNEIWCDSGARVRIHAEPARGVVGLGLYYEPRGTDGVWVTRVAQYSPASRAGLSQGDRILAIDGKDTKKMQANQVRSAVNLHAKTGLKLDVWYHNGNRHVVTIKEGAIYPVEGDEIELPKAGK